MKKYQFHEEINRIDLFDERFYEIIINEVAHYFPSVTTYLEGFPKGAGYKNWLMNTKDPDKIMNEAGQLGTNVHDMINRTLLGETIKYTAGMNVVEWERYLSWCIFWKEFTKMHVVDFDEAYMETMIWNKKYRVAGTYDLMPMVDGKYEMFDWKTGKNIYETSHIQISTYAIMCMLKYDIRIDKCRLIHLYPDLNRKGYRVTEINGIETIKNNFVDFVHTQKVWLRSNKSARPKFKSYPTEINLDFIKENDIVLVRPEVKKKEKPAKATPGTGAVKVKEDKK